MASILLPEATHTSQFEALARDDERLVAASRHVAQERRLDPAHVERFRGGSLPVFAIGPAAVLKWYPPCFPAEAATELGVLRAIDGKLPIPTPHPQAEGELDGWRYVLMERLGGELLSDVWPHLDGDERCGLAAPLGEALATLHAIELPSGLLPPSDWSIFVAQQRAACRDRQARFALETIWLEQISTFLAATPLPPPRRPALLHTEVMREHLFVERHDGRWVLSGLFDFEPAMVGSPEYEFASVGIFVAGGEPRFLDVLLRAYGYGPSDLDEALQRRFMAYALLHRYSKLSWYLERLPPAPQIRSLEALAGAWWPFAVDHVASPFMDPR